jgi:hypothetical protein
MVSRARAVRHTHVAVTVDVAGSSSVSSVSGLFAEVFLVELVRRQVAVALKHAGDRQRPFSFVEEVENDERMEGIRANAVVNVGPDAAGKRKCREQFDGALEVRDEPLVAARMPLRVPGRDIDEVCVGVVTQANADTLRGQRCFFSDAAALRPRSAMSRSSAEVSGAVRPASMFATAVPTASRK